MAVPPPPERTYVSLLSDALEAEGHAVVHSVEEALHPRAGFDVVHFHWPEALWGWSRPVRLDPPAAGAALAGWARLGAARVWTRHNARPHHDPGPAGREVARLLETSVDGVVHLGGYSLETGRPGPRTAVIPHGVYPVTAPVPRTVARRTLRLEADACAVLVFGAVRHVEEQRFVARVSRELAGHATLRGGGAVVLVPRWREASRPPLLRAPLRRMAAERLARRPPAGLRSGPGPIPESDVPLWMAACDAVLLPRIDVLNSGVLLLALSHGVPVVGPRTGNLTEVLDAVDCPSFAPGDAEAAARALIALHRADPRERGRRAREVATRLWNWPDLARAHLAFYRSLSGPA